MTTLVSADVAEISAASAGHETGVVMPIEGLGKRIADLEERVKERYKSWGLLKPGDQFALSYDRISVEMTNFELGRIDPREGRPISLHQVDYINNGRQVQEFTFRDSRTVERSLSVSVTTGFKYKTGINAGVSIKKILEIGGSKEFEFSLSTTTSTSVKVSQTAGWDWKVMVHPKTRVVASALLANFQVEPLFTADLRIAVSKHPNFDPGYHPVYVSITRDGNTKWWRTSLYNSLFPMTDGFSAGPDHNTVNYRCRGQFAGTRGRKVYIRLDEYPIDQEGGAPTSTQIFEVGGEQQALSGLRCPEVEEANGVLAALQT